MLEVYNNRFSPKTREETAYIYIYIYIYIMELREAIAYTGPLKSVSDELLSREKKKKSVQNAFYLLLKRLFSLLN
jgi:hypothetical protein